MYSVVGVTYSVDGEYLICIIVSKVFAGARPTPAVRPHRMLLWRHIDPAIAVLFLFLVRTSQPYNRVT